MVFLSLALLGQGALAQSPDAPAAPETETDQPSSDALSRRPVVSVNRLEQAPVIDGVINPDEWAGAATITDFTQVDPIEGGEPSERTIAYVAFDSDRLFVAIRAEDSDASGIRATQMKRDGDFAFDDVLSISIDPFFNSRDGYLFEMTPPGAKRDALLENNRNRRFDWDGIWRGRTSMDAGGWSAEFSIPYKTIGFNPNSDRWGLNIERRIRRKQETIRWAGPQRTRGLASVSSAGIIEGLEDLEKGIGLDIKPFITFKYADRDGDRPDTDFEVEGGVDLFYKITPDLTFAVTVNTDFAETEVDERRVNLTRFSLFFPEKRDFFLQDAGLFEFGGIRRNPLPYFSRRIGIGPDGKPIDIIAGLKLTGRIGDLNVGLLNVQLDEGPDGLDAKNVTVGRFSYNVLEESQIGIITTIGDPQTNGDNFLIGTDFNYRNSTDFGDDVLTANAFFMHTETSGVSGPQNAFGGRVRMASDNVEWFAAFTQIDDTFNPALGFSNRRGIREYIANARKRWRPTGWIDRVDIRGSTDFITDTAGNLETYELEARFEMENRAGDEMSLEVTNNFEDLDEDFEIQPGVVIPDDDYTFTRGRFAAFSSSSRPLRVGGSVEFGEFFDGDRLDLVGEFEWRPNRFFAIDAEYEENHVDLPDGDFVVRIARSGVDINFTPFVSWDSTIQWDNISELLGINSRVKWIIDPGQEVFFVVNQGFTTEGSEFESLATEVTLKVGLTIRF